MKAPVKSLLKQGLLLGINAGAPFLKRKVPVIVYHSVDDSGSCISITEPAFRRHMEMIKEGGYKTMTARELVECIKKGSAAPENALVLTFDDGFLSNYSVAFPILREMGFTATIFLTTGHLGKWCTWDKKPDIPDLPLMTWEMAREMGKAGIDFQTHTATHPHLPLIPDEAIREEVRKSRAAFRENLGRDTDILCYPYAEFDDRVIRILREEGIMAAFAGQPNTRDIYSIRRIGSGHLTTGLAYRTALKGYFEFFYALKKIRRKLFL